jgi:hypothetical protein
MKKPSSLAASVLVGLTGGTAHAAPKLELLVPAYFYPAGSGSDSWQALDDAAARVGVTAIVNVNSGPGDTLDPNYLAVVESLRAAGGRVLGYVHTSWGGRDSAVEQADVDAYLARYPSTASSSTRWPATPPISPTTPASTPTSRARAPG